MTVTGDPQPITLRAMLQEAARTTGLQANLIEKDYALSYILAGISAIPALRDALVFKGGTCLKKLYFSSYRFSEDLDFTATSGSCLKCDR